MFQDKKKKVAEAEINPNAVTPAPTTAGAPTVKVRKRWDVGKWAVSLDGGVVCIGPADVTVYNINNSVYFSQEYAAAIADALLQAS